MEKTAQDCWDMATEDLARIYSSDDPWREFMTWLEEQRDRNNNLGGDENSFMAAMVCSVGIVLPAPTNSF
jgi:hypothetical protein